jgi:hypothetical protein
MQITLSYELHDQQGTQAASLRNTSTRAVCVSILSNGQKCDYVSNAQCSMVNGQCSMVNGQWQ